MAPISAGLSESVFEEEGKTRALVDQGVGGGGGLSHILSRKEYMYLNVAPTLIRAL